MPNHEFSKLTKRYHLIVFWIIICITYALLFILPEFLVSPVSGWRGAWETSKQFCAVCIPACAMLWILCCSRRLFTLLFTPLLLLSVTIVYFQLTMGVRLTPAVVELTLVNNFQTATTVVSTLLIVLLVFALAIGILTTILRCRLSVTSNIKTRGWGVILSLVIILIFTTFIPPLRSPVRARLPFCIWFSVKDYVSTRQNIADNRTAFDNVPVRKPQSAPDIIVVLGESLRPDHLGLNGYTRNTTPFLSSIDNLVSLPHITTEPFYTHTSLPRILTRADSLHPDLAYTEPSFITLFNRCGYATAWISNQDAADSYAPFMHEADTLMYANASKSLYDFNQWLDTDILPLFNNWWGTNSGHPRLVVIHTIGQHWWYKAHRPDSLARFQPETDSRIISELSTQQLTNTYDNTVLATDNFLYRLIKSVGDDDVAVIFISDHGESLGENSQFLHGHDMPILHPVACMLWRSKKYDILRPERIASFSAAKDKYASTDAIFHTVLHVAGLRTSVCDTTKSLLHKSLH